MHASAEYAICAGSTASPLPSDFLQHAGHSCKEASKNSKGARMRFTSQLPTRCPRGDREASDGRRQQVLPSSSLDQYLLLNCTHIHKPVANNQMSSETKDPAGKGFTSAAFAFNIIGGLYQSYSMSRCHSSSIRYLSAMSTFLVFFSTLLAKSCLVRDLSGV